MTSREVDKYEPLSSKGDSLTGGEALPDTTEALNGSTDDSTQQAEEDSELAELDELLDRDLISGKIDETRSGGSSELNRNLPLLRQLHQLRVRHRSKRLYSRTSQVSGHESESGAASSQIQPDSSDSPRSIGRFRLTKELGRGGYGIVYLAEDRRLGREVALKVPRLDALVDSKMRHRFLTEARIAANLDHSNIVSVYEAGEVGPVLFIAYAYCAGITLAEWIARHPTPVAFEDAARLLWCLADGVEHAHQRGVLHRDLKPANVMLQSAESISVATLNTCIPKITDFGLASVIGGESAGTQSGMIVGTPNYMSPEQASGGKRKLLPATDIYALGTVLYELLTGQVPFRGDSPLETLQQIVSADPISIRILRPRIPKDLETICGKCLQKEPQLRYASAAELRDDLNRFLLGQPIAARPVSRWNRYWRLCKRHPLVTGLVATLCLLATASSLAITTAWLRTRAAYDLLQVAQAEEREARSLAESTVYFQSVALAHQHWRECHVGLAQKMLEKTAPQHRDWEWNYVQRLCQSGSHVLGVHPQYANDVAYSSDGKLIASCSGAFGTKGPGEIAVWNPVDQRIVWRHTVSEGTVRQVEFSGDDQKLFCTIASFQGSVEASLIAWDVSTGKQLFTVRSEQYLSLATCPATSRIAAGGGSGTVYIHDPETGQIVNRFEGHQGTCFGLDFTMDGNLLVSGSWDHSVRVWDVSTGNLTHPPLQAPADVRALDVSPDGSMIAAGLWNGEVWIWETLTGRRLLAYQGHTQNVAAVCFSPDSELVYSAGGDRQIRVWNCRTGRDVAVHRGHNAAVQGLSLRHDGLRFASCGNDRGVREWDVEPLTEFEPLKSNCFQMFDAAFPPNPMDGIVMIGVQTSHLSDQLTVWRQSPNTQALTTGTNATNSTLEASGMIKRGPQRLVNQDWNQLQLHRYGNQIVQACLSDDTRRVLTLEAGGMLRLWNAESGEFIRAWHIDGANCCDLSSSGDRAVVGNLSGELLIQATDEDQISHWMSGHEASIRTVAWSRDASQFASGADDGTAVIWEAASARPVVSSTMNRSPVTGLAFSNDGRQFGLGSENGDVYLFSIVAGSRVAHNAMPKYNLVGHLEAVTSLSFFPGDQRLVTGSRDMTIRLWDTQSGIESFSLSGHAEPIRVVRITPEGEEIVSLSGESYRWRTRMKGLTDKSPEQVLVWHRRALTNCELNRNWYGVLWHTERMESAAVPADRILPRRANALAEQQRWQESMDAFDQAIQQYPNDYRLKLDRGLVSLAAGDSTSFSQYLRELFQEHEDSDNPSVLNSLAWWCCFSPDLINEMGGHVAQRLAQRSLDLSPSYVRYNVQNTMALLLLRNGQPSQALTLLDQIRTARPGGLNATDLMIVSLAKRHLADTSGAEVARKLAEMQFLTTADSQPGWVAKLEMDCLISESDSDK